MRSNMARRATTGAAPGEVTLDLQPFRGRLTFDDAAIGTRQGTAEWVAAGTAADGDGGGADVYLGPDDQHRVVEGPGAHAADDVDAREPGSGDMGEQHTRVGQLVRVPGDLQDGFLAQGTIHECLGDDPERDPMALVVGERLDGSARCDGRLSGPDRGVDVPPPRTVIQLHPGVPCLLHGGHPADRERQVDAAGGQGGRDAVQGALELRARDRPERLPAGGEARTDLRERRERRQLIGGQRVPGRRPGDPGGHVIIADERLVQQPACGHRVHDGRGHQRVRRRLVQGARHESHRDAARAQQPSQEDGLVDRVAGSRTERAPGTPKQARIRLIADPLGHEPDDPLRVVAQGNGHVRDRITGGCVGRWRLPERPAGARTDPDRHEARGCRELQEPAPVEHDHRGLGRHRRGHHSSPRPAWTAAPEGADHGTSWGSPSMRTR